MNFQKELLKTGKWKILGMIFRLKWKTKYLTQSLQAFTGLFRLEKKKEGIGQRDESEF